MQCANELTYRRDKKRFTQKFFVLRHTQDINKLTAIQRASLKTTHYKPRKEKNK